MKLSNGNEATARRYQEQDEEPIVNLIRRNFWEVNVKDYGEKAMKALAEHHELFLYADRIEIPAFITAVEFCKKQGYDYKNGVNELDDEGHYRLEKFNVKKGVD